MQSRTLFMFRCAILLLALACVSRLADAQVLYGSLTGNVTDPSSAAVPGVKVTALNVDTGVTRQADTDARGAYLFSNLQLGTYKVTIEAKGFQTMIVDQIAVKANEVRRVDFEVKIAQATETVEVLANSAVLQTDKSDVHSEISECTSDLSVCSTAELASTSTVSVAWAIFTSKSTRRTSLAFTAI